MIGHADCNGLETGGDEIGDAGIGAKAKHESQWSRPERGGEPFRLGWKVSDPVRSRDRIDVHDQRIEPRPTLRLEDARDGSRIGRISAQAVDSLGREGHEIAVPKRRAGLRDRLRCGLHQRHRLV